jgi:hypothetical protein
MDDQSATHRLTNVEIDGAKLHTVEADVTTYFDVLSLKVTVESPEGDVDIAFQFKELPETDRTYTLDDVNDANPNLATLAVTNEGRIWNDPKDFQLTFKSLNPASGFLRTLLAEGQAFGCRPSSECKKHQPQNVIVSQVSRGLNPLLLPSKSWLP